MTSTDLKTGYMNRGLFLSFEGIDGSGKSIQAEALAKNLTQQGYNVCLLREPGGTAISERIRDILLDKKHLHMGSIAELFLYEAARAQILEEKIRPALLNGYIVLCDRFMDSTTAYQGYGRSLPLSLVRKTNEWVCGETIPDRTFFLDITWNTSLKRRAHNLDSADRMEKQALFFFEKVRHGYLDLVKQEPHRFLVLDGNKSVHSLEQVIKKDVLLMLKQFNIKKI